MRQLSLERPKSSNSPLKKVVQNATIPFVSLDAGSEQTIAASLKVVLEQLMGGEAEANEQQYVRIVNCISPQVEERLRRFQLICESFEPIWPRHQDWTRVLMQRLGQTLVPESSSNEEVKEQITKLASQNYNSLPLRTVQKDSSILSQELLILIFLTMMGISFPVSYSYDANLDGERAWSRELMLRVIKAHGPSTLHEYSFLTPLETNIAHFLQQKYP